MNTREQRYRQVFGWAATLFLIQAGAVWLAGEESAVSSPVRATLEIPLKERSNQQQVQIPRQFARLHSVHWKGRKESLQLRPEAEKWTISWKERPTDADVIVVKLLDPAISDRDKLKWPQLVRNTSTDLPAHDALTHGMNLRYEPQPHKNTLGYWTNPDDWASWRIDSAEPGDYRVEILQGCGKGQGGSRVRVLLTQKGETVDEVVFTVEETGHFQNFRKRNIGVFTVPRRGEFQIEIRPEMMAKRAVMDVRKLILVPTDADLQ